MSCYINDVTITMKLFIFTVTFVTAPYLATTTPS